MVFLGDVLHVPFLGGVFNMSSMWSTQAQEISTAQIRIPNNPEIRSRITVKESGERYNSSRRPEIHKTLPDAENRNRFSTAGQIMLKSRRVIPSIRAGKLVVRVGLLT